MEQCSANYDLLKVTYLLHSPKQNVIYSFSMDIILFIYVLI